MRTNFRGAFAGLVRGIPATVLLIVANVAVYAAMSAIDQRASASLDQAAWLARWGANVGGLTFTGEPWRLLTSMFVHAGFLHLAFNCLALLEIGGVVERRLGAWRTLAIYLLAGLGGAYASARWHSFSVSVGASGAIFGLLAALIVLGYLARGRLRGPYGDPVSPGRALVFGALTLALGLFFNFDNAAHLGGFAVGAALSLIALLAERTRRATTAALVFALAVIASAAALASLTAQAFDPELAARVRFAQLMAVLRAGNADAHATLRRCALASAGERGGAPAEAFSACLGETLPDNDAALSRTDIANRYAPLLEHNRREVWPACRRHADQLLRQDLPATRRALVGAMVRYCDARARIEATVLPDAPGTTLDAASLRQDLLHYELLAALADRRTASSRQQQQQPEHAALRREAAALAQWQASITPEEDELARLADCPLISCRRARAR